MKTITIELPDPLVPTPGVFRLPDGLIVHLSLVARCGRWSISPFGMSVGATIENESYHGVVQGGAWKNGNPARPGMILSFSRETLAGLEPTAWDQPLVDQDTRENYREREDAWALRTSSKRTSP